MGCPGLKDSCPILTLGSLLAPWGLHGTVPRLALLPLPETCLTAA